MKCSYSAVKKMAEIASEQLTTLVLFGKICVIGLSLSSGRLSKRYSKVCKLLFLNVALAGFPPLLSKQLSLFYYLIKNHQKIELN